MVPQPATQGRRVVQNRLFEEVKRACLLNDIPKATSLVTRLANVDRVFQLNGTPTTLLFAVVSSVALQNSKSTEYRDKLRLLKILARAGADTDWKQPTYGCTPLLLACSFSGNAEMVGMLIWLGADVELGRFYLRPQTSLDEFPVAEVVTPLLYAVLTADLRTVITLIERGAHIVPANRGIYACNCVLSWARKRSANRTQRKILKYVQEQHYAEEAWGSIVAGTDNLAQTAQAQSLIDGVGFDSRIFVTHMRKVLYRLNKRGQLERLMFYPMLQRSIKHLSFYYILTQVTMNPLVMKRIYAELLCANCNAFLPRSVCGQCLITRYCDVRCQTAHWNEHTKECSHLALIFN